MPIVKTLSTPNGLTTFHKFVKATFNGENFSMEVRSYPSEDKSTDANLLWQEYPNVPASLFDPLQPTASLEKAVTQLENSPFCGGTYVPEKAVDLQTAKDRKWAEIKLYRDAAESAGFDVEGIGRFDSDSDSRARIIGATSAAKIATDQNAPITFTWTLADNSVKELSSEEMIKVGFVLLQHLDSVHQKGRQIREAIDSAESVDVVVAIVW